MGGKRALLASDAMADWRWAQWSGTRAWSDRRTTSCRLAQAAGLRLACRASLVLSSRPSNANNRSAAAREPS